jgi:ketosteroid isomerase-like protein
MKPLIGLLAFLLLLSTTSVAQPTEEKKVAATVNSFIKALLNADKNELDKLTAPNLNYGHSSGKVENKSDFIKAIVSGQVDFITIDLADQIIQVSGDIAIIRHIFSAKVSTEGKPSEIKIGNMLIFHKNGEWKLLARQGYKL